jgi:Cu/Zn superoxide dismutase
VGLVVLLESYRTFYGALSKIHDPTHAGALASIRLGLSGSEIVAALLFLIPFTALIGGYALLAIFGAAIVIHGVHGDFTGLEILVLYGVAVLACLAQHKDHAVEGTGDGGRDTRCGVVLRRPTSRHGSSS